MASSPSRSKSFYHNRSKSLPSRTHPWIPQIEEHLGRLSSCESASSSLSIVGEKLSILEDIQECLDDFLLLPNTRLAFSRNEKWVEKILDGSLMLLDLCAAFKNICSQAKGNVQDLLSLLRRRKDNNEFGKYLTSRKITKKFIKKSLKNVKNLKIKHESNETEPVVSLFQQVEEANIKVFESLMSYIGGLKSRSRLSGFVSNRILRKTLPTKGQAANTNEFENMDAALELLVSKNRSKFEDEVQIETLLKSQLEKVEVDFEYLAEGTECLFRRLIKSRVALLNVLNH